MIGLLSDIHGNLEALEAVFRDGQRKNIHRWICLGDIVGYGPNPSECIQLVRNYCEIIVLGNHDEACGLTSEVDEFNKIARHSILWTRTRLKENERDWLRKLPLFEIDHNRMYVHASPRKPHLWNYIFTETEAQRQIAFYPPDVKFCFIGHTHESFHFVSEEGSELINVGSVGQPRDYDSRACFAIFDENLGQVVFQRVEYDIKSTQKKIIDYGLPRFLAERLMYGN